MKKILMTTFLLLVGCIIAACGQEAAPGNAEPNTGLSQSTTGKQIPITLTIGDTVLDAYLEDSAPAQSLLAQLPLTVTLNDSDNDFCGGNIDISYSAADVTTGYKNGDLAFWTPAKNFVIFVSGEENSANTGDLVKLGRITGDLSKLNDLSGQIDVSIALKNEAEATVAETNRSSVVAATAEAASVQEGAETMQIKITVGNNTLYADLENNATTRALVEQMPMTLPMSNLYGREMCYRYGGGALPTDNLRYDGYEVGDIAYWPPRGSLVILYRQNGEHFERQHLGHIPAGTDIFANIGDEVNVTFERVE